MVKKNIMVVGGATLLLFALLAMTPQFGGFIASFESPASCMDEPYASNCYCGSDEEKLNYRLQYFCESLEKKINPDVQGWELEATAYAIEQLTKLYPECDMIQCNTHGTSFVGPYSGVRIGEGILDRVIGLECVDAHSNYFSRIQFGVEYGDIYLSGCGSYDEVIVETTSTEPMKMSLSEPDVTRTKGNIFWNIGISSSCGDVDNGINTIEVVAPEGEIGEWVLWSGYRLVSEDDGRQYFEKYVDGTKTRTKIVSTSTPAAISGTCSIIDTTETTATIKCDTECPHPPFDGFSIYLAGYFTDEYYNNQVMCEHNGIKYEPDTSVICNEDGHKYTCESDGTWFNRLGSHRTTGASICPVAATSMCMTGGPYWTTYMPGEPAKWGSGVCQTDGTWLYP